MGRGQDREESGGSVVLAVPRPRGQVVVSCLVGLVFTTFGLAFLWVMMKDETVISKDRAGAERISTRPDRWPASLPAACFVLLGLAVPVIHARTSLLEIRRDGLIFDRKGGNKWREVVPWDQIGSCHWNPYRPGILDVPGSNALVFIKVPRPYWDQVEAALRQVGKWSD